MSPAPRRDASTKPAWFCRSCKLQDGQPARNFGDRTSCFRCRLAKGVCHGGNAPGSTPSKTANGNHATWQTSQASMAEASRQAELRRLAKEIVDLKLALGKKVLEVPSDVPADGCATPILVEASQDADPVFSDEQLFAQRKLYLAQGVSEQNQMVKHITDLLKSRSDAKMAEKPGHIRMAKTAKAVKQCQAAIAAAAVGRAKLLEEVAAVHARLAAADVKADLLREALVAAEREHDVLLALLHTEAPGARLVPPVTGMHLGAAASHLEAGSDDEWAKLGIPIGRLALISILRALEVLPACQASPESTAAAVPVPRGGFDDLAAAAGAAAAGTSFDERAAPASGLAAGEGLSGNTGGSAPTGLDGTVQDDSSTDMSVDDVLSIWKDSSADNRQELAQELVASLAKRRCLARGSALTQE
jgi:hypothetical protein